MFQLNVAYMLDGEISEKAETFLDNHHKGGAIPVPIEEIVEFVLGMDIVPVDNLQDVFEVDGFLSSDFSTIYIDKFVYLSRPTRYRFTLAHEVGHLILHRGILDGLDFKSVGEWQDFVNGLDPYVYQRFEYQGPEFAGRLLVPTSFLKSLFASNLDKAQPIIDETKKRGLARDFYIVYAIDAMAEILAPHFNVSTDVIERRIKKEKLDELIP